MSLRSPRVLLADPQHATRHLLLQQLEDAGYNVEAATTGGDVMLLCGVRPPDVLILDVRLPDVDGFEVCEYVRHETRDKDMTVILTTEPTDELTRTYLAQMVDYAGGDYFLVKPYDGRLIVQLLDELSAKADTRGACCSAAVPTRVVWPTARSHCAPASH